MHNLFESNGVTYVEAMIGVDCELEYIPMIRRCRWRQRDPGHSGAQFLEPEREPAPFEAGMSGHENATSSVDAANVSHAQRFHGACPDAQSSSRWFLSLSVSIACQKPSC